MKNTAPYLSVIMTSYNYEKYLPLAIESVLKQTFGDFEFIIVESGSTDSSPQIVQEYANSDSRIRPVFLNGASNSEAFHEGMQHARGTYIARTDSDDIYSSKRLEEQLRYMKAADLDLCGSWYKNIGAKNNSVWCPVHHHSIRIEMLFRVVVINSVMMMKAELAKKFPLDENIMFDDYEWPIRVSSQCRIGNVPMILLQRRRHKKQASIVFKEQVQKERKKLRFQHFYSLYPETPLKDYLALVKIFETLCFESVQELKTGGKWLLKLAENSELSLIKKMRKRWKNSCLQSGHSEEKIRSVFLEYDAQFNQMIVP